MFNEQLLLNYSIKYMHNLFFFISCVNVKSYMLMYSMKYQFQYQNYYLQSISQHMHNAHLRNLRAQTEISWYSRSKLSFMLLCTAINSIKK